MYWWGVGQYTAWQWWKALGVRAVTEGTSRLKSGYARGPGVAAGRAKAHEQSRDPEKDAARREKIAASKRGKARPPHVSEAMRRGRTGKPQREETRAKMREAHRRRWEAGG